VRQIGRRQGRIDAVRYLYKDMIEKNIKKAECAAGEFSRV
jgi:hypothetical protein